MKSFFIPVLACFLACSNAHNNNNQTISTADSLQRDSILKAEEKKKMLENLQPVFGYRFVIEGDFDGNGKKEKLIEHFYSMRDNKETNKFYKDLEDYGDLVDLTVKKKPYSFVTSDAAAIDTLDIRKGGQVLGLSYLKNEGDLDGDGGDEVSYVGHWADWSNLNTWHVMTYKKGEWQGLYAFDIWDWQLPDLPETFNQYGMFGLENKIINTENDSVNKMLEAQLFEFEGLVKKVRNNKIRVIFQNDEGMRDTMIVDLKTMEEFNPEYPMGLPPGY